MPERKDYIGSTEAAAIMGFNPYQSRTRLWLEKTGRVQREDVSDKWAVERGNALEPHILKRAEKELKIEVFNQQRFVVNEEHEFIAGHVDGEFYNAEGELCFIDAKSSNIMRKKEFNEDEGELPANMICQGVHFFACCPDYKYGIFAVDVDQKVMFIRLDRDEEMVKQFIEKEVEFWNWVQTNTEPPMMPPYVDESDVKLLFPNETSENIIENPEFEELITEYMDTCGKIKTLEDRKDELKLELEICIGNNTGILAGNKQVTWKSQKGRASWDTKQLEQDHPELKDTYYKEGNSFRVMRTKEIKTKE